MNDAKAKSEFFDLILKKHGYYEAKNEVVYDKRKDDSTFVRKGLKASESSIEDSKAKVNKLKKQLMDEEQNLLKLYKNKNK